MANFDLASLAISAVCPNNVLIYDDKGLPGVYVKIPKMKLSDLLANGDSTVHPAFRVSGVEQPVIYIGKYQGVADDNRIYSLPGVDPRTYINPDTYEQYCKNKGRGHHCITAAEWAFLALWCKKNGFQPKGNNYYGKDNSESVRVAIPSCALSNNGRIQRVATGTGPLSWRHNNQLDGICDLNGNVWEWTAGIRLVKGELQVIPYNNAADPNVATNAASAQWKAVKAAATSWEDLFITPNGSGTTTGSVKLDWVSNNHWQWGTSIASSSNSDRSAVFSATTSSGLSATAKLYLQAMALLPEDGASADDYCGNNFSANNGADERCAFRSGAWAMPGLTGVFLLALWESPFKGYHACGSRPAFAEI